MNGRRAKGQKGGKARRAASAWLPLEMREKYTLADSSTIDGTATYARFRRYQVVVDEKVK
jgi:hypothetical protein